MKKYQVILCTGETTGPFDHIDLNELPPDAIRVEELALLPTGQFWLRGFQSATPEQDEDPPNDDCALLSTWEEILADMPPEITTTGSRTRRYKCGTRYVSLKPCRGSDRVQFELFFDDNQGNNPELYHHQESPISRAELAEIINWVRKG